MICNVQKPSHPKFTDQFSIGVKNITYKIVGLITFQLQTLPVDE
jgi:hypothetical protein